MLCRSFASLWWGALSAALLMVIAPTADAAVVINQNLITRTNSSHNDPVSRLYISRSDCTNDDALSFVLALSDFGANPLQVWATDASADCSDPTQRGSSAALCWKVYESSPLAISYTARVRVQDIIKGRAGMSRTGTRADCDAPAVGTGTGLQQITLYFMIVNGDALVGAATNWSTKLDLNGPAAPTGVSLGRGGTLLKVNWDPAFNDPDVAGYRVYVDSRVIFEGITDPAPDAGASTPTGNTDTTSSCSTDAGSDADDEGGSDGAACEASTASDATATGSDASTSTPSVCTSALPAGQIPTSALDPLVRASSAGNTSSSATITGLTNGQLYNVAIAAYDLVGNSGPLTNVVCDAPEPVYGFSEAYTEAGGTAGGGFCSLGRLHAAGARGGLGAVGVLGVAAWLRRRRRLPA